MEDLRVNNILVVPRGGVAWATITEAQPKPRMGSGGKLDVNIDSLRLKNGENQNSGSQQELFAVPFVVPCQHPWQPLGQMVN